MTLLKEEEARDDLMARGIFRMAPGLWCDKSVPDFIEVDPASDTALQVRNALKRAGQLPRLAGKAGTP